MTHAPDKSALAAQMTKLWQPLTADERTLLLEHLQVLSCTLQQTLFDRGDEATCIYYLLEGRATLYGGERYADELIVRMVEPGSIFGVRAAFSGGSRTERCVAEKDSVVALVPLTIVSRLIWENPQFALVFIHELSELLGTSVNYTIHLTQKNIRGRLAESLLRMKEKYGVESDGQTLAVYLSRSDMALMSNMSTSNAIRTLSSFASEGIIRFVGRKISIVDEKALRQASQLC